MQKTIFSLLFSISFLLISCEKDSEPIKNSNDKTSYILQLGHIPAPKLPEDNPLTKEGVALGRKLFYEKALSLDNSISCASCHTQAFAFSDTNKFSIGVGGLKGKRQAMAIVNLAWNDNDFFWDGRAHLLRDQALMPIEDPLEMQETLERVIQKLKDKPEYLKDFKKAFDSEDITEEKISLALEQFMFTLVSYQSKYDQVQNKQAQFTPSEERGRKLFFNPIDHDKPNESGAFCVKCHGGPNFTNNQYMNNGLDDISQMTDVGRFKVTDNQFDFGSFRVPTLRNIAVTEPYMHDGRFQTLEEVIDHYDHGVQKSPSLDLGLLFVQNSGGLKLSVQQKKDLIAFLNTLTDTQFLKDKKFSDPF
ncbi:MAG: cytochrome-c peroxidase [Flavobacteriales bacterium]|jgi:cytochrome c peroxidase|nr:cytochrome-c peroxidase [Flavobacteriales bacterium]